MGRGWGAGGKGGMKLAGVPQSHGFSCGDTSDVARSSSGSCLRVARQSFHFSSDCQDRPLHTLLGENHSGDLQVT